MKHKFFVICVTLLSLTVLLAGCGTGAPGESSSQDSSAAQVQTTPESESTASSEADPSESTSAPEGSEAPTSSTTSAPQSMESEPNEEESDGMKMQVQVGETTFTATLEENTAVDALVALMEQGPVTIQMNDYAGFEKVGALGTSLPTSNQQTTTQAGDIVLYQGNQIVMFYGSNSWSYTRLGHIDDLTGWQEALGSGDITATFSLEQ